MRNGQPSCLKKSRRICCRLSICGTRFSADDYIGEAGQAHVDWSAKNWEELLFADMLKSLTMFADTVRAQKNLTFLFANEAVF